MRDNFSPTLGQVNFDGKLLDDLNGLQKVNRLAVLVVKETENQILGIAKTANATGEYFFYISFYIFPISLRLNPDYSIINNLFINPQWRQSTEFQQVKAALKNLSPVNDSCERALALATTFNGLITKDEESYQELVLVVEAHRKKFKLEKKSDLKNVF